MKPRLIELVKPQVNFRDIAKEYGCHPSFVSQVASGYRKAPLRFKLLTSKMLGLPVNFIFPESGDNGESKIN